MIMFTSFWLELEHSVCFKMGAVVLFLVQVLLVELKVAPLIFNWSKNDNRTVFSFDVFFAFAFLFLVGKETCFERGAKM